MASDLRLRRTLTVRSPVDGAKLVLTKNRGESREHVLMKAALWVLYRPHFPDLRVEVRIGDAFKPDLVALAPPPGGLAYGDLEPTFWGEAGKVTPKKWASLLRRFPDTHFVWARWNERLQPHAATLQRALGSRPRRAALEVVRIPPSVLVGLEADGTLDVRFEDEPGNGIAVERVRVAWGNA
ncbi:hypothetical protein [Rubrivirga sp.]|uniref:hypothetical protein n=1 Tax=Rubrivirga sp. TaxID=1885344 RepID=UPI003C77CA94